MTTIPKERKEELNRLANRIENLKFLRKKHLEQIREAVGPYIEEWEGITNSGVLIEYMPGTHSPIMLGIPFSIRVLQKAFPELEVS